MTDTPHNDKPITDPSDDRFGIDPFAKTLAASIREIKAPEGTVVALNGPWGSGKSSAVNLILHHLNDAREKGEIVVINFACWWFRGEESLALEFFRELYAGLSPSLGERAKKILPKLAARVLSAGSPVGATVDLTGATAGFGTFASKTMSWLSGLVPGEDTVEKLHRELNSLLDQQNKRFLIVIDDVDRLSPDEALLMFRLVKSVGRLPNVIYLLVFDRELAESIISERYPSEGPHYLEKIIQAGFDVPLPRPPDLYQELLRQIDMLCGSPSERDIRRFMNVFYDVIAPEIQTPRDLIRLTNVLAVTWPAVGRSVDRADLIAVETFRLLRPGIYRTLRSNKDRLCGSGEGLSGREQKAEMDSLLLGTEKPKDHDRLRRALMRLFPRLSSVWSNIHYRNDSTVEWRRDRLVCSAEHFDSYFRFSIGDNVLPREEFESIIARAADSNFIKEKFRKAVATVRKDRTTKAMLLLEELNLHADNVAGEDVGPFLKAIFELADELDVAADEARGFSVADNQLRIHWLLRRLTERFDLENRSKVLVAAAENAALCWLVNFADSAYRDYHPLQGDQREPERCLTTESDAYVLRAHALERIRRAAQSDELSRAKQLPYLLYRWREFSEDDGAEVKEWTAAQMKDDAMIAALAKAFTSYSWSQSTGDRVAMRNIRAEVDRLDELLDVSKFRKRVEELAAKNAADDGGVAVREFLSAWQRREKGLRD
jgi:predicted KAP-like P-loop ATPase